MNTRKERAILLDALGYAQHDMAPGRDTMGLYGFGVAALRDGDGRLGLVVPFANVITDTGDQFIASKIANGINSQTVSYTNPNGMKLGLLATAVAKTGTGSYIAVSPGDYITGSARAFDTGYPTATIVSSTNGWTTNFQCLWPSGTVTATIASAEICDNQGTDAGHTTVANTLARTVFSPAIAKGSSDSLTITWKWTADGAGA